MKKTTKTATTEPKAYAEVGTYMYRNNGTGKVSVKMHTSVNKPLALDDADEVLKVKKIRVETHVVEDKGLTDGVAYQKDIETIQLTDGDAPETSSSYQTGAEDPVKSADGPSPLQVLKNFVDNIAADVREKHTLTMILVAAALVLGTAALILAIV